jgi:hypothetical protein
MDAYKKKPNSAAPATQVDIVSSGEESKDVAFQARTKRKREEKRIKGPSANARERQLVDTYSTDEDEMEREQEVAAAVAMLKGRRNTLKLKKLESQYLEAGEADEADEAGDTPTVHPTSPESIWSHIKDSDRQQMVINMEPAAKKSKQLINKEGIKAFTHQGHGLTFNEGGKWAADRARKEAEEYQKMLNSKIDPTPKARMVYARDLGSMENAQTILRKHGLNDLAIYIGEDHRPVYVICKESSI